MQRKTLIIGLLHQPTHPQRAKMEPLPDSEVLKGRQLDMWDFVFFTSEVKKPFGGEAKCTQSTEGKKGTETNMSRNYWEPPQTHSPHYYYWSSNSKRCRLFFRDPQVSCIHKAQWTFSSITVKSQLRIDDTRQLWRLAFSCGSSSEPSSTSGLDQHQTGPG